MRKIPFFVFLAAAVYFILLFRYSERAPKRHYNDFRVYYSTAQQFIHRENIYSPADVSMTPYKYSPMFALMTAPLGALPEKPAALIFFSLNFLALGASIYFSMKLISPKDWPTKKRLWLIALTLVFSFRFILGVLDSGQVNLLMIALAVSGLYYFREKKTVLGALLLALSVMIKYMTFIFVPYLLVKRKFKEAVLVLAFIVLYGALPAAVVGVKTQTQYMKDWLPQITQTSLDRGSWTDYKNQSVYSWVIRSVMKDCPYPSGWPLLPFEQAKRLGIFLAMALYLLMVWPKGSSVFDENTELALLFCGLALFNPNSWPFNYASMLFAGAFIFYALLENGFRDKTTCAWLAGAVILMNCAGESLVGEKWQHFLETRSLLTLGGLIVVALLLRLKFFKNSGTRPV
jgi:hypothetical protein